MFSYKSTLNWILFFISNLFCLSSLSQHVDWVNKSGSEFQERVIASTTDDQGYIYTTGVFSSTVDFDPGSGTENLSASDGLDIFITKSSTSGDLIWAKKVGGASNEFGLAIETFNNDVYVSGIFRNATDFDPGPSSFVLNSNTRENTFLLKLDEYGSFVWVKQFASYSYSDNYGRGLAIDANGGIYLTGSFGGTVDFDPESGSQNISSVQNSYDIFLSKFDVSGNILWVKTLGGNSFDGAESATVSNSGDLFITGSFSNTIDLNPSTSIDDEFSSNGYRDVFVSRYDANGNNIWNKTFGGTGEDIGKDLSIDGNNNIYTTGTFENTVNVNTTSIVSQGGSDFFVNKIDVFGNHEWIIRFGTAWDDESLGIEVFSTGNAYITGNLGGDNAFIYSLDSAGNEVWSRLVDGTGGSFSSGNAISIDSDENLYVSGNFGGLCFFVSDYGGISRNSNGQSDNFTMKMSRCDDPVNEINLTINNDSPELRAPYSNSNNFRWFNCDDFSNPIGFQNIFNATENGDYAVVIQEDGCIDTSDCVTVDNIGIEEFNTSKINVFPNPSDGLVNINSTYAHEALRIKVFNATGQIILSKKFTSEELITIDLEGSQGLYILEVSSKYFIDRRNLILE